MWRLHDLLFIVCGFIFYWLLISSGLPASHCSSFCPFSLSSMVKKQKQQQKESNLVRKTGEQKVSEVIREGKERKCMIFL